MNTFKTLLNKVSYKSTKLIKYIECDCTHCDKITCDKMKKCQECGDKKVCKECYYNGKILCKECDDELMEQYDSFVLKSKVSGCDYCNDCESKSKKCDGCGKRKICKDCYYDSCEKLCKECNKDYIKWGKQVEQEFNDTIIENNYYEFLADGESL